MSVVHPVVSQQEWLEARKALLAREKEMTHLRDAINRHDEYADALKAACCH